jgi:hypothetical protein
VPTSKTQKLFRHKNTRKGVLVPLLEDLFMGSVEVESQEDVDWIANLLSTMVERQKRRTSDPVFSPSQLSECLRYVYLLKHSKELQIPRLSINQPQPNYYFFTGNFLHIKWQFALYKLDQKLPDEIFKLIGVEVPILSKRKDHGGTVDALALVNAEPYIIDFKGLNVRTFGEITRGYIPRQYSVQLSDYGMLYNAKNVGKPKISKGLLIVESKGGPDPKNLIALHESEIEIETFLPEVKTRLKKLRKHGEANSIPKPECESTTTFQFQGCPFRKYCRKEVKEIQRLRREDDDKHASKLSVARSKRSRADRTRRNSNK